MDLLDTSYGPHPPGLIDRKPLADALSIGDDFQLSKLLMKPRHTIGIKTLLSLTHCGCVGDSQLPIFLTAAPAHEEPKQGQRHGNTNKKPQGIPL